MDIASLVSSVVPWIGAPVSNVLSGMSFERKIGRVREVLEALAADLASFKSEASEHYVKTEEFEELLETTLRRAAEERSAEKRRIYRDILVGAVMRPSMPYDSQLKFLKFLDNLQPLHIRVMRALLQAPAPTSVMMGSASQTLVNRLKDISTEDLTMLIEDLNTLRLTNLTSLNTMMTGRGAQELHHYVTSSGHGFVQFVQGAA